MCISCSHILSEQWYYLRWFISHVIYQSVISQLTKGGLLRWSPDEDLQEAALMKTQSKSHSHVFSTPNHHLQFPKATAGWRAGESCKWLDADIEHSHQILICQ